MPNATRVGWRLSGVPSHIALVRNLLIAAIVLLTAWGVYVLARRPAAASRATDATAGSASGQAAAGRSSDTAGARRAMVLQRVGQADSYLPAMLAGGDSIIRRWQPRVDHPVTVYLPGQGPAGYVMGFDRVVREAFTRWQRATGIPVHFLFSRDSAGAEVRVRWIEKFPMQRAGQADVVWNQYGWLVRGTLTLATHTHDGWPLTEEAIYTVALHEIGHLLGLGHSDDPRDLMYPSTSVQDLTGRDRQTAALLYALPPGRVGAAAR